MNNRVIPFMFSDISQFIPNMVSEYHDSVAFIYEGLLYAIPMLDEYLLTYVFPLLKVGVM